MDKGTPIKTIQKTKDITIKEDKTLENPQLSQELTNPLFPLNNIRKKREYKTFIKTLKEGKAISGIILAKALGIDRGTLYKWFQSPQAQKILSEDLNKHVSIISEAKDWKAHAYLIDTAIGKEDITNIQVNTLDGLTIIRR